MEKHVFATLSVLNVNEHVEKKTQSGTQLSYLSWTWAWANVKTMFENASYEIWQNPETHLPYVYDPNTGYMVFTSVTIEGVTHSMWLPVMDGNNRAMKSEPYEITTKFGKKISVAAATMFDVNKTIMRCLTKNLAMHGLGLYIYAGEDLPDGEEAKDEATPKCDTCGGDIVGYRFAKGDKPASWIGKYSVDHFGKRLCGCCLERLINDAC